LVRVAIDAMGGDAAPGEVVKGAVLAAEGVEVAELILVGDEGRIREGMEREGYRGDKVRTLHAGEVVEMGESPVEAIKRKPDSSLFKAVELAASGGAEAVVSAGNTGAFVAAATLLMKHLPGVKRAGIAATFPTYHRTCTVIDVGANIRCRAEHLLQYGVMASEFAKSVVGVENPEVGLLNIGEEVSKGNDLVKRTHKLLVESSLRFVGNVEGRDIFSGECDVAVCDGFVGNMVLKVTEGLSEVLYRLVEEAVGPQLEQAPEMERFLGRLRKRTQYAEFGGAPLLGVNGVCVICHGRSEALAIRNAIAVAAEVAREDVNSKIVPALSKS